MALKDIIGHDRAIHILRGCIAKYRIPHSLIFTGDKGVGKQLTAVNFAKTLNCLKGKSEDLFSAGQEKGPDSFNSDQVDACDECSSCRKIEQGNHPDVYIIGPEGDGGQITVSAIRQLEESLSYKPFEGAWKIAVIDDADRLNQSAANAFLQTLEEPSAQSILILISSRPDMILSTIRSRCQKINFSPLPVDRMSSLLEEQFGHARNGTSETLSILSGGRLGYALNDNLIERRDWSFNIFLQMMDSLEEEAWGDKETMEDWFEWSQLVLRDIAVYKATGQTAYLVNRDRGDEIKALSQRAGLQNILKLARELYNIKRKLIFNLNKQLTSNYVSLLLKKNFGQSAGRS
jgi:DNA polymerase-3 subunit delta'